MQNKKFKDKEYIKEELNKKPQVYTFVMHTILGFECEISKECNSYEEYVAFATALGSHIITNALFHNSNS